jgi:PAS domain-containing protein
MFAELADRCVERALDAARQGGQALHDTLEALPAPTYVTDAEGVVIAFNQACVGFAGRRPTVGVDRWCVTWKLYDEDGRHLPHHRCPMAVAVVERRAVRGACAIAERPDGTRVTFVPFPTPLIDARGELAAAVNVLVDVTDLRQAAALRAEAEGCRRLAAATRRNAISLDAMAEVCDARAAELEARHAKLCA